MIHFYKYQGAGNDFILIDNRAQTYQLTEQQVAYLCHRHMGIGADGLMLLEQETGYDFRMKYYNSDGKESTMCGNGGRCITAFAKNLNIIQDRANFSAIDGAHEAIFTADGLIQLQMQDVHNIEHHGEYAILNTGSPHYVSWQTSVDGLDVFSIGRTIRNQACYQPKGINVNFAERTQDGLFVRTYERGVENETLSCGTGVTAAAIASTLHHLGDFTIPIKTLGGNLTVTFTKTNSHSAHSIFLTGPAEFVFEGTIKLP